MNNKIEIEDKNSPYNILSISYDPKNKIIETWFSSEDGYCLCSEKMELMDFFNKLNIKRDDIK